MRTRDTIVIVAIIVVLGIAVAVWTSWDRGQEAAQEPQAWTESEIPISITDEDISEENFTGSRPVISGTGVLADQARRYADEAISAFRLRADTEVPEMREKFGAGSPPASYSIDIRAEYMKGEITESIIISEYVYTGGANGSNSYRVYTASLKDGKMLTLSDAIRPERREDFAALVRSRLMAWRPAGALESVVFPEEVGKITFQSLADWSMDKENLVLYFDEYEVGPGALGAVVFPLALADLRSYLASEPPTAVGGIEGCYVFRIARDVYTLRIENDEDGNFTGFLNYDNYQKDSSSGPISGTYEDDILLGDYSFTSEGMFSIRQVIFKKDGDSFVQGFGPAEVIGNRERLRDPKNVTYDPKLTFKKEACPS